MNKKLKTGLLAGALTVAFCATPALTGCGNTDDTSELNSKIETLQSQNDQLTTERNSYKNLSENQANQIGALESRNADLTNENTSQAQQIADILDRLEDSVEAIENSLQTNLNEQIESLQSQNSTLQSQNENLQAQNETLQSQNETLTTANSNLTTANSTLTTDRNSYKTLSEAQASQIETLQSENQTLTNENTELETANTNLSNQNANLTEQNQTLTEQIEPLQAQIQNQTDQISSLQSQNSTLQSQNDQLTNANEELTTANTTLANEKAELTQSNEAQANQIITLKSIMAELNAEINVSYKNLFNDVASLTMASTATINGGFDQLVDFGKTLYVVLKKQTVNFGETYEVIIQSGNDSTELRFKLSYGQGKYHVYFVGTNENDGSPTCDRYSFGFDNYNLTSFEIYQNGRQKFGSDSIVDNVCSNEHPAISFSDSYNVSSILAELTAELDSEHQITISQGDKDALVFGTVLHNVTQFTLTNTDVTTDFYELVDMGKNLYVASTKKELNLNEVYQVTVPTTDGNKAIPFKLACEDGKYHVYFLDITNDTTTEYRYTFTCNSNGDISKYVVYKNGKDHTTCYNVSNNNCDEVVVSFMPSTAYDSAEIIAELTNPIANDHQITITQAEKDAIA